MRCWIEATGDYQWNLRLDGKIGLNVPVSTRYKNMLCKIKSDDCIFHHITSQRAEQRSHQSAIVGISRVILEMYPYGKKLIVDLKNTIEFPVPINFSEYSKISYPSEKFDFLLTVNLQRYITEIEKQDAVKIIALVEDNINFLKNYSNYQSLI